MRSHLFLLTLLTLILVVVFIHAKPNPHLTPEQAHQQHHALHTHPDPAPHIHKLKFATGSDDTLSLSVTPASGLSGPSAFVTISWVGNVNAGVNDWIAAYSPVPNSQEEYLTTLPVKYMNLTTLPGPSGSIDMWLLHMRAPWIFAYMRGGFEEPTLITTSNIVTYDPAPYQANLPMQIHLIRTVDPTEMMIMWVTTNETEPIVQYATSLKDLSDWPLTQTANTSTYTRDDMCGGMAATIGWRDPGAIHQAILTGLTPGQQYFYRVTGLSYVASPAFSFFAAPLPGADIDFFIFGDMGQAEFDGTIEWEEWTKVEGQVVGDTDQPPAINTTRSLRNDLADGTVSNQTGLVMIIGDVSYARGREAMWDQFSYLLQPVSVTVPIMTLLGNHEYDWNYTYWPGTDSGGECGVSHQSRFPMPSPPSSLSANHRGEGFSDTPWYSFEHGAVHFLFISSEHDFSRESEQYAFILQDLMNVNRTNTPWVIMASHRPMYVSSPDATSPDSDMVVAQMMRDSFEPLLLEYEVDAFFAGHHHDYQRSCVVFNETCVQGSGHVSTIQPDFGTDTLESFAVPVSFGTVHTVTGAAGQWCNVFLDPSPLDWLEFANEQVHGYTRGYVRGEQLTLEFVASADRQVWDSVTITKGGKASGRPPRIQRNKSVTYAGHDQDQLAEA